MRMLRRDSRDPRRAFPHPQPPPLPPPRLCVGVRASFALQTEGGVYELEGELDSLRLPTTLNDSIRMRLATVRERDPDLDRLLRLAAVMAGCFTQEASVPHTRSCHRGPPQLVTRLPPRSPAST